MNKISDTKFVNSSTSSSAGSSTEHLKAPTGAKSKASKYFGFATNEAGEIMSKTRVKCTLCKNDISFCGNTTNLSYHSKQKHPVQFSECYSVKQGSAKAAAASHDEDQPAITECFACKRHINMEVNSMKHVRMPWWNSFSTRQHCGKCKFLKLQQNTSHIHGVVCSPR